LNNAASCARSARALSAQGRPSRVNPCDAWLAPIGVFDSGVGGLTVLRALTAQLPGEHFVYLGDTARLPYGTKSPQTVARYSLQAAEALTRYGVKCLVIACNTASSVGLSAITERIADVPVIGVIEPGAEAACAASRSGNIAVIATEGTVREGAYQRAILRRRPDARINAQPAPLFVALAEEGLNEGPIANDIADHYLKPIFEPVNSNTPVPDTLVLGCTHFPMLAQAIRRAVGATVRIVDSAATTAASVDAQLRKAGLAARGGGNPLVRLLATDGRERFARVGSRFLERPITPDEVELVDL
jgi:glutamate racemase